MRFLIFFIALILGTQEKQNIDLRIPPEITKDQWFTINTKDDFSPSMIDANHWLDAPAGKYGVLQQKGDHFEFTNGKRIKFWGVNIADKRCFPKHAEADRLAAYWAKYGVNAVRFHKFTWDLTENMNGSIISDSSKFELLDYLTDKIKERGIYFGWSHIYGLRVQPGDSSKLLAYQEIKNLGSGHLKGSTYNLVYFAPDLQDLSINLTVSMLNHVNPYTGMKYADDPAFCFLEFNNEDNLFFASAHSRIMAAPTYKKLIQEMFSEWLLKKYNSQQGLENAWGIEAMNAFPDACNEEDLSRNNIYPMANHGILSSKFIDDNPKLQKRIWDTARFLYETQNSFYDRFEKAVRKTGYKGPIVASGWQAGDNIAHLYNLHSDYLHGFIDRHNYYGGGRAGVKAMVDEPGMGLLSSGLQQVKDRPFALSEWISVMPNEWLTEAAPLVAVYGMGLQGWDASYSYASNHSSITNKLNSPIHGVYNADAPTHMGLYPALSRMVYRGDVKEADVVSTRYVNIPGLEEGKIGFEEKITQIYDVKDFTGTVPREAMAVGRSVIEFVKEFKPTPVPDFSKYWNKETKHIQSITGQLDWDYSDRGFITINTPGTVGFMGFAPDSTISIGDYLFRTSNKFAVVLLTSLDKDKNLKQASNILVSTFARAENTGMIHNEDYTKYIEEGKEPILMEPVNVSISFKGINHIKCQVLDFQGRKQETEINVSDKQIMLNGAKYKTNYYLLEK
jgi:hypothetical protein